MSKFRFLSSLSDTHRWELAKQLHSAQGAVCFIYEKPIDLVVQANSLDIDHVISFALDGADEDSSFAWAHSSCNGRDGSSHLCVAHALARFSRSYRARALPRRESQRRARNAWWGTPLEELPV